MRIEVHHSRDAAAVAVATRVSALLDGSMSVPFDPADPDESACRVIVDGRPVASVLWFRRQQRMPEWIAMTAGRIAATLTNEGFGGHGSPQALHREHGVDGYKSRAIRRAKPAAKAEDRQGKILEPGTKAVPATVTETMTADDRGGESL